MNIGEISHNYRRPLGILRLGSSNKCQGCIARPPSADIILSRVENGRAADQYTHTGKTEIYHCKFIRRRRSLYRGSSRSESNSSNQEISGNLPLRLWKSFSNHSNALSLSPNATKTHAMSCPFASLR